MQRNGLLECLKYSLPPNWLSFCGPDKKQDLKDYYRFNLADQGLSENLSRFYTLYGYLSFIACENNIREPFDIAVVKAYWLGNRLLKKFNPRRFYYYLRDNLALKKKLSQKELTILFGKIPQGALPNHAFHVFNIPWRTGFLPIEHTLQTMDACRISWGKVISQKNGILVVETPPVVYKNNKLQLGKTVFKKIVARIDNLNLADELLSGELISFHWGFLCNKINPAEADNLRYYTQLALNLANEDICIRQSFN